MNVILSTRNPSKMLQIQQLFADSSVQLLSLDDAGIDGQAIEDGSTLEHNAFKKAKYAYDRSRNAWTMADDTGLFIHALGGEPGVHAATWAGDVSTEEITQFCLQQLAVASDRSATFETVVYIISPTGAKRVFTGNISGTLLPAPRVPAQPKMPYSPLFVPDGEELCWAEMTNEYENRISHRGIAFRKAKEFLEQFA